MELTQKVTPIFEANANATERIVVNRGGTRSSKTTSLLQLWIEKSFTEVKKEILITRREMPALKLSSLKDFIQLLQNQDLERFFEYRASSPIHFTNKQTGTKIYFVSSKDTQKVHGVQWDYIQLNEGNEIPYDTFRQFLLRTEGQIFIDFNPSDSNTWIKTELEDKRQDAKVITSSYLDNPFLSDTLIQEIEYLRETDLNYWNIYGLGEYGNIKNRIYTNKKKISLKEFEEIPRSNQFLGIDWGYVHPSSVMLFKYYREKLYGHLIFYESYKDVEDIIKSLKACKYLTRSEPLYCDHSEPASIKKLRGAGFKALKADKTVGDGIKFVRSLPVFVTDTSIQYWKENEKYKFREHPMTGEPIEDEPVKFDDDAMDAERYAIYSHLKKHIYRPKISGR